MANKKYSTPFTPMHGLKLLRKDRKLSQAALGEKLGISGRTVQRYESPTACPRFCAIGQLCEALHCESWQLFHKDPIRAQQDGRAAS